MPGFPAAPDGAILVRKGEGWVPYLPAQAIKLDDLAAPDDNADLNATASLHGLMSKTDKAKLDGIWVSVPASAGASGTAGQMAYEPGFLYICVATNTWQRVAIATW